MSNLNQRLKKLEIAGGQRVPSLPLAELERRISFVLKYPQTVSEQVYSRIVAILDNCRRRQAEHE